MISVIYRAVWLPLGFALLFSVPFVILVDQGHPIWGALFLFASLIFFLDARGRVNDLVYLLSISKNRRVYLYGRYMRTACGRQVMIAVDPRAQRAYYEYGYRWYHILPDYALTRKSPLLNSSFWRQLFSGHRNAK